MDPQAAAPAGNGANFATQLIQAQAVQIQALQAQLKLLEVNPQPALPSLIQQGNPNAQIVPSSFSFEDTVEWLDRYVACAYANGWTFDQRVQRIPPYLIGQANILYRLLADGEKDTWARLILLRKFILLKLAQHELSSFSRRDSLLKRPSMHKFISSNAN